jgi:hypothetical protein
MLVGKIVTVFDVEEIAFHVALQPKGKSARLSQP